MRYFVLIDGEPGGYGVVFPDLPGCVAMGDTVEKAMANAADVLRDWLEFAEENGVKVPPPRPLEEIRAHPDVVATLDYGARLAAIPVIPEIAASERPE